MNDGLVVDRLHWSQYDTWNEREAHHGGPKYDYIRFEADVPAEAWSACQSLILHHGTPATRFLFHERISKDLLHQLQLFVQDTGKKYKNDYWWYKPRSLAALDRMKK